MGNYKNREYHQKMGEKYGYKQCCIDYWNLSQEQEKLMKDYNDNQKRGWGFILCESCAASFSPDAKRDDYFRSNEQ